MAVPANEAESPVMVMTNKAPALFRMELSFGRVLTHPYENVPKVAEGLTRPLQSTTNMKCQCEECYGTGTITCPDCNGQGEYEGQIENINLVPTMHNYTELKALQGDANRVIRQATRLKELNPARAKSYICQLKATLWNINAQAEAVASKRM
jgi:hypothetical protein